MADRDVFSLYLPRELRYRLEKVARDEKRSLSRIIRDLVEESLEKREQQKAA
jgi:predicted transcriptional regulator